MTSSRQAVVASPLVMAYGGVVASLDICQVGSIHDGQRTKHTDTLGGGNNQAVGPTWHVWKGTLPKSQSVKANVAHIDV